MICAKLKIGWRHDKRQNIQSSNGNNIESFGGIFGKYADKSKREMEDKAWGSHVVGGIDLFINSSNSGTVKAKSPCDGL